MSNVTMYSEISLASGVKARINMDEKGEVTSITVPAVTLFSTGGVDHLRSVLENFSSGSFKNVSINLEDLYSEDQLPRLSSPYRDVQGFQRKFPLLPDDVRIPHVPSKEYIDSRIEFYEEELGELRSALLKIGQTQEFLKRLADDWQQKRISKEYMEEHWPSCMDNFVDALVEFADAHGDLIWILYGTMDGFCIPFEAVWHAIVKANMNKEYRAENVSNDHKRGIYKPQTWVGPEEEIKEAIIANLKEFYSRLPDPTPLQDELQSPK